MCGQYNKVFIPGASAPHRSERVGRAARSDRGAALVLALLIVALLLTLVLEFDRSVRLEHRAAGNYRDATAAFYLAKAGLAEGRLTLLLDGQPANTSDNLTEAWALPGEMRLGPGIVRVSMVDEERFFPINSLVIQNTVNSKQVEQFQRLLRALKIDDRLADAVIDWLDQNDDPRPGGAESAYYQSLTPPYHAHNLPMDSVEELRLIKGVTNEIYDQLAPHLTAVQPGDNIRINLNTADPFVLGALDAEMTPDVVKRVIAARPIKSGQDATTVLGNGPLATRLLGTSGLTSGLTTGIISTYFTIEGEGIVNGISKVVTIRLDRGKLDQKPLWVRTPS